MTTNNPTRVGLAVLYTLTENDAAAIIEDRIRVGRSTARGNTPRESQRCAAIVVADWQATKTVDEQLEIAYERERRIAAEAGELAAFEAGWPDRREHLSPIYEDAMRSATCNLQVFLDGNDTYWATSRSEYVPEKHESPVGHFEVR